MQESPGRDSWLCLWHGESHIRCFLALQRARSGSASPAQGAWHPEPLEAAPARPVPEEVTGLRAPAGCIPRERTGTSLGVLWPPQSGLVRPGRAWAKPAGSN